MLFLICRSENSVFHLMFQKWKPAVKKNEIIYRKLMEHFIYAQRKSLGLPILDYYWACHIIYLKLADNNIRVFLF